MHTHTFSHPIHKNLPEHTADRPWGGDIRGKSEMVGVNPNPAGVKVSI